MKYLAAEALVSVLSSPSPAQDVPPLTRDSLVSLAAVVAPEGSAFKRTSALTRWISTNLRWSATDYQRRTPEEILARGEGNCAELAAVLDVLLDAAGIQSRWIREINVHPVSEGRQQRAEARVAQTGFRSSVFGREHNDHVWLEVWDDSAGAWFPADPAYGVVGFAEWLPARLAFRDRPGPAVAAAEPIVRSMLVPFAIVSLASRSGPPEDDRSMVYLRDRFNQLYGGRLETLPAWTDWIAAVRELAPRALAAFRGEENLHHSADRITSLKDVYDELGRQAAAAGLSWR